MPTFEVCYLIKSIRIFRTKDIVLTYAKCLNFLINVTDT